ncbi:MAG: hypothetical protein ACWA47_02560 [Brevirhabdus sp.]
MPDLIAMYIRHIAIGFVLSAVFVAALFYFNVANLWHLVSGSSEGWIAALMLWVFNGIVFSGVQFAVAVISMGKDDDDDDDRGTPFRLKLTEERLTIPVRVDTPKGPRNLR